MHVELQPLNLGSPSSGKCYVKHSDDAKKLLKCAAFLQYIILHLHIPGWWTKTEEYLDATSL